MEEESLNENFDLEDNFDLNVSSNLSPDLNDEVSQIPVLSLSNEDLKSAELLHLESDLLGPDISNDFEKVAPDNFDLQINDISLINDSSILSSSDFVDSFSQIESADSPAPVSQNDSVLKSPINFDCPASPEQINFDESLAFSPTHNNFEPSNSEDELDLEDDNKDKSDALLDLIDQSLDDGNNTESAIFSTGNHDDMHHFNKEDISSIPDSEDHLEHTKDSENKDDKLPKICSPIRHDNDDSKDSDNKVDKSLEIGSPISDDNNDIMDIENKVDKLPDIGSPISDDNDDIMDAKKVDQISEIGSPIKDVNDDTKDCENKVDELPEPGSISDDNEEQTIHSDKKANEIPEISSHISDDNDEKRNNRKTEEDNNRVSRKSKRVVVKSQDKSYTRKVEQGQKNDLKIELQLNGKGDNPRNNSLNKVSLHDDQDELDYNEDLDEEVIRNRGGKELEEEGEIAGDDDNDDQDSDMSSDGELEDDDDCEEGEIKETEDFMPITKPICKFFTKGTCSWGNFCKFIHPNAGELGNYSLIDTRANMGANMAPNDSWTETRQEIITPVEDVLPPPPPPATPPLETAWERGLRHAKEMKKKAKKRKENDACFEDKRLNQTLSPSKDDNNKENNFRGGNKDNLHENVSDDEVTDEYYGVSKRVVHGRHDRNLDDDLRTYQLERRYYMPGREVEIHRGPTSPVRALEDRSRPFRDHRERENRLVRSTFRGRGNRQYSPIRHHSPVRNNISPVRRYAPSPTDNNRTRRKRYVSPYVDANDKSRGNNRITSGRTFGALRMTRGDEWTDPWQRTKSPKRTTRRSASRSRSRGRRRYRSSSAGSSSSYSSSSYTGSSRSRSRSYSSSSSYSSRSSRSGSSSYSSGSSRSRSRSASPKRTVRKTSKKADAASAAAAATAAAAAAAAAAPTKMVPFIKKEEPVDMPAVLDKTVKTSSGKTANLKIASNSKPLPVNKNLPLKVELDNGITLKPSPLEKNVLHSTRLATSVGSAKTIAVVNAPKDVKKVPKVLPASKTAAKVAEKTNETSIVPDIIPKVEDDVQPIPDSSTIDKKSEIKTAKITVPEKKVTKNSTPALVATDKKVVTKTEKTSVSFPAGGKGQKQIRSRKKERSSSGSSSGSSRSGSRSSTSHSRSRSRSRTYSSRSSSSSSSGSADSDHLYRDISPVNKKEKEPKIRNKTGEAKTHDSKKKSKSRSSKTESKHKKASANSTLGRQLPLQNGTVLPSAQGLQQNVVMKKAADPLKILGQKSNIKLTLSNKAAEKATGNVSSKKRAAPAQSNDATPLPVKKAKVAKESKAQVPAKIISKPEKPLRAVSPMEIKEETIDTTHTKPVVPKKVVEASLPVNNTIVNPIVSNKSKKSTTSRREELLKQLKAVEDAIAKKRSKMVPAT